MPSPVLNICQYRVKPGKEAEMEELLAKHWPALHAAGLVSDTPAVVYKGLPDPHHGAERCYVEMFSWKDASGPQLAHKTPEVMAVWEPMGAICEHMEFPSYARLDLD
ncbi:MAG: hypothetical protein ACRBN8_27490 [Nannocystales bacterium]